MARFVPLLLVTLATACASAPWPGEERVEHDESFDATSAAPQAAEPESTSAASGARGRPPPSPKARDLAERYRPGPPLGPPAADTLSRHYARCRAGTPPAQLVMAGHAEVEAAGAKRLGPVHWVMEPEGRFLERLTLAASADDLEYGEGVESERGFDGQAGWRKDARGGAYFVDDAELELFALDARLLFGRFEDVLGQLEYAGTAELEGAPAQRISGRSKSGELFHLYFHRDTHQLLGFEHVDPAAPEKPLASVRLLETYQERGLCLPRRVHLSAGEEHRRFAFGEAKFGVKRAKLALPAELRDIGGREGL